MSTVIGLAGSLAATSRSTALVAYVLELLAARDLPGELIKLSELPADALLGRGHDPAVDAALARVANAGCWLSARRSTAPATPASSKPSSTCCRGPPSPGCTVGLIATGGIRDHALAIDHALRPLVASLEGLSAAHAVYATDADLESFPNGPLPDVVAAQLQALADELHAHSALKLVRIRVAAEFACLELVRVRGPAAPRRQSLLRSQARCALLPAATPAEPESGPWYSRCCQLRGTAAGRLAARAPPATALSPLGVD